MKKLLLLLLPVLLLTACDKDKKEEPATVTAAKNLAGTYSYRRVGELIMELPSSERQVNMDVSGTATITHAGGSDITITFNDSANISFTGHVVDNMSFTFGYRDRYSFYYEHSTIPAYSGMAYAEFDVTPKECVYGAQSIIIRENYDKVRFKLPSNSEHGGHGHGLMTLYRQQ